MGVTNNNNNNLPRKTASNNNNNHHCGGHISCIGKYKYICFMYLSTFMLAYLIFFISNGCILS